MPYVDFDVDLIWREGQAGIEVMVLSEYANGVIGVGVFPECERRRKLDRICPDLVLNPLLNNFPRADFEFMFLERYAKYYAWEYFSTRSGQKFVFHIIESVGINIEQRLVIAPKTPSHCASRPCWMPVSLLLDHNYGYKYLKREHLLGLRHLQHKLVKNPGSIST